MNLSSVMIVSSFIGSSARLFSSMSERPDKIASYEIGKSRSGNCPKSRDRCELFQSPRLFVPIPFHEIDYFQTIPCLITINFFFFFSQIYRKGIHRREDKAG